MALKGLDSVIKNLNKEISNIEGDIFDGLKAAGLFIEGEAVELAPAEFDVLRGSSFSQAERRTNGSVVKVGFTAEYAAFVHEMPMKNKGKPRTGKAPNGRKRKGSYWSNGENKFLEKAVKRNMNKILKIIAIRAKI